MTGHWLMKTEPSTFSIDDLRRRGREPWDGVRNYQARNMIRDQMRVGDGVLIYHSNCDLPAVVGIARVASPAYPDPSALDPGSRYFDPASTPERPRWYAVDVAYEGHLPRPLPLAQLRTNPELDGLILLKRGSRLSVMPVSQAHWTALLELAGFRPPGCVTTDSAT
ncbi:MAG TPA: EVE domain-containing protein [Candidatus Macondimonas sp.]|nr:EVE domain-containing protein [Candidatus Macondimonas sp.]